MYYLYVISHSLTNRLYIGSTDDVDKRIREHNKPSNRGYTHMLTGVWQLKGSKEFATKNEARKEENRLKKAKNRKYVLWYIEQGS